MATAVKDQTTHAVIPVNGNVSDDELLAHLGYKSEFRREFSVSFLRTRFPISLIICHYYKLTETVCFAFSIMGVIASVSSTLSFGLVSGA